jgi:uncharacterized protein YbbC (DUF1343 family)
MVGTGLDIVREDGFTIFQGQRIGLLVHGASVASDLVHATDLFHSVPTHRLTALFGPQHGLWGETQDNMVEWEGFHHPLMGIPVYSLYGESREPTEDMLSSVDTLVVDLQDVGTRCYTFIWTMGLALKACARSGKRVVILDRPNPINGIDIEGPILDMAYASFVGLHSLPVRHAMTIGEVALLVAGEQGLGLDLDVVPLRGWKRSMWFDETGLPWVMPSPNMPLLDTAIVYPGMCLLEGTTLSEGRGTTRPFEICGAPWIDPWTLDARLKTEELPGVAFRPLRFIPTFNKWSQQACGGVQLHVIDRDKFRPFLTALSVIQAVRGLSPDRFNWKDPPYEYETEKLPIDLLAGTDRVRKAIARGDDPRQLDAEWQAEQEVYLERREPYLLYR